MAFAGMFIAAVFIFVVLIGLGILLFGVILDIIWIVRKAKKKNVHAVLKVFAILLTVVGLIVGIGPIVALGSMQVSANLAEQSEIADFAEDDFVYVDEDDEFREEFEFHGELYVAVADMSPQVTHDNYVTVPVGAIMRPDGNHLLIYSIENTMGIEMLTLEQYYGVYVPEDEADKVASYYEDEAPLYAVVFLDIAEPGVEVWNIDSGKARQLLDQIETEGEDYTGATDGYIFFYSTDDLICFDTQYAETKDGVVLYYRGDAVLLDKDGSDFIMSIVDKAG